MDQCRGLKRVARRLVGHLVRGKFLEDLVHLQQTLPVVQQGDVRAVQLHALLVASMANLCFAPGDVDEDAAHRLRGRAEEVGAVLPGLVLGSHQAQPGLVNERGGLKRLAGHLDRHSGRREVPQFPIHERQQFLRDLRVAPLHRAEDLSDLVHPR